MNKKEIIKILYNSNTLAVLIGDMALNMYNSPRLTHDMDFAVKTIDIDNIIDLMYKNGFFMVSEVLDESVKLIESPDTAKQWLNDSGHGSMTFIYYDKKLDSGLAKYGDIDITTQVDFLFELSIPAVKLKQKAVNFPIDDFSVTVASLEDILILKNNRKGKSASDYADIDFIKRILEKDTIE